MNKRLSIVLGLCVALLAAFAANAQVEKVDRDLQDVVSDAAPGDEVSVIIRLKDKVDLEDFQDEDEATRRSKLIEAKREKAKSTQEALRELLKQQQEKKKVEEVNELWLIDGLAATVPVELVDELAKRPEVESVRLDGVVTMLAGGAGAPAPPGWNLNAIWAPDLWALGVTGTGIVVATMDSGADVLHPDLGAKWRGGSNSWFDPHGQYAAPNDTDGHGTQALGIILGGDAGGQAIGVAPGAQWIAVRIFDSSGQAPFSVIHQGFQWLLDPDGDPATDDAPDIVNNSWSVLNSVDDCITEFADDIAVLKAAGIAVVFAGGNAGPFPSTSMSSGNNPGSVAVGSVDPGLLVDGSSSRGPSACDGGIYPHVTAPGVDIHTADLTFGGIFPNSYVDVSGTSFAAPHLAGAVALLQDSFPHATVSQMETAIDLTALDLGPGGPDDDYGAGLVDLTQAYNWLAANVPTDDTVNIVRTRYNASKDQLRVWSNSDAAPDVTLTLPGYADLAMDVFTNQDFDYRKYVPGILSNPGTVTVNSSGGGGDTKPVPYTAPPTAADDLYVADEDSPLSVAAPGVVENDSRGGTFNVTLAAVLETAPANGSLTLNADGSLTYTPDTNFNGTDSFAYKSNDGKNDSNAATVSIIVNALNDAPVAAHDNYSVDQDSTLSVAASGVLGNDSDVDGDPLTAVPVSGPANGTLSLNGDGSFIYTPNGGFNGSDSFTYMASDGADNSNSALVTITVNPVAGTDTVNIIWTRYRTNKDKLIVRATSDAQPSATLALEGYGNMNYKAAKGYYQKTVNNVASNPGSVTVNSSGGGSDTKPVPYTE